MKEASVSGHQPPSQLDGAGVIEWFYFAEPFRTITVEAGATTACHGAAICRYDGSDVFYCFTCSIDWEVLVDTDFASARDAKNAMHRNFDIPLEAWKAAIGDDG